MSKPKRTPENVARALLMWNSDVFTLEEIAKKFGLSVSAMRQWVDPAYYAKCLAASAREPAKEKQARRRKWLAGLGKARRKAWRLEQAMKERERYHKRKAVV